MSINRKYKSTKAITTRFSLRDHSLLLQESEKLGTTLADVIRVSWSDYQQQKNFNQQLDQMEKRLIYAYFEINCLMLDINEHERQSIKDRMQKKGISW